MKKVFIVHGWASSSEKDPIYGWLKAELEAKGFEVSVPDLPNSEEPKIDEWMPFIKNLVPNPDEQTFFITHSLGGQATLRYLESLPENTKIGGVVMIAPWVHLLDTSYEEENDKEIAKPWLETPIDWEKVKSHTDKFVAIFSDNDFCVPLSDKDIFKGLLGAEIIVEDNKGHFTDEDNITEIPSALNALLEMAK